MHDNFKELLDVRKSLKNKFFGLIEEEQTDNNKKADEHPNEPAPQIPHLKNNSNPNILNPQNLDEREKSPEFSSPRY